MYFVSILFTALCFFMNRLRTGFMLCLYYIPLFQHVNISEKNNICRFYQPFLFVVKFYLFFLFDLPLLSNYSTIYSKLYYSTLFFHLFSPARSGPQALFIAPHKRPQALYSPRYSGLILSLSACLFLSSYHLILLLAFIGACLLFAASYY